MTVADELAKKHKFQSCQAEALILMRAAIIIHKLCLESQEPFNGSFSANCLTAPVNKNMRIFFNTVLQGQATVNGKKNINDNTNQDARDKIACIVSQLLMYNATKGVHHTVRTDTVRHSKERETPFPLYYGLKLHALGRQTNQIGIAQEQGICVSYSRVMEVKLDITRAVCARHAEDGVVVPTNCRMNVFTTHDVDNLDGSAKGNNSMDEANVPLSQIIKRNNMLTFANRPDTKSKSVKNSGTQKHNTTLVTQLFLSLQSRPDADILDFFRYENQKEPPSLADRGMMRSGAKSDILSCLNTPTCHSSAIKEATVMIFDMAAVINMIRPTLAKNFREYVSLHIIPYFKSKMSDNTQRLDAVWDTYPDDNLKALTQQKRGNGARIKVGDGSTPIPRHEWNTSFLKNEDNKKELFAFISKQLSTTELNGRLLLTTHLETVLSNKDIDLSSLEPCNHAEADTRIMLHLAHAAEQGHTIAYVRTVDSDVVVLTIHYFHTFGLSEL